MSGVLGSNSSDGYSPHDYKGGSKYGNLDNKSYSTGYSGINNNSGLGAYGNYSYNKSTLDKYKDNNQKTNTIDSISNKNINTSNLVKEEKKESVIDNKKPFERVAPKLIKPGSKPQTIYVK